MIRAPSARMAVALVGVAGLAMTAGLAHAADPPPVPRIYAIVDATVTTAPGKTLEKATIVLRDGRIEAVGASVKAPADAVVIDGTGRHVYAGFVDPLADAPVAQRGPGNRGNDDERKGPVHPLPRIRPETRAIETLTPFGDDSGIDDLRELGYTTRLLAPTEGILRGSGVVVQLHDDRPVAEIVLREDVGQHAAFERGGFGDGYPTSLMGAVAATRQALLDAERHRTWTERHAANPAALRRPETMPAYEALRPLLDGTTTLFVEAGEPEDVLLADRVAREFDLDLVVRASGHEWEIADRVAATGRALLHPVTIPDEPDVDDPVEALDVDLRTLRRHLDADEAPARLADAGIRFAFTLHGVAGTGSFHRTLVKYVAGGLDEATALAALTTVPADLLGLGDRIGTLAPGKVANVAVFDKPAFEEEAKTTHVFVDGRLYEIERPEKPKGDPDAVVDPRGTWAVTFDLGARKIEREWTIAGEPGDWSGTAETGDGTVEFESVKLEGNVLTVVYPPRGGRGSNEITVIVKDETFEGLTEMGPRVIEVKGTRTSGPEGER